MECDPTLFDGSENDDMYLEKVLAMTESLDPGLGYVLKSKVDLPVNVSINNAARRYLFSANPENDGQFRGFQCDRCPWRHCYHSNDHHLKRSENIHNETL